MNCPYSGEQSGTFPHNEYSVIADDFADINGDLIGLSLTTAGRFGNALIGCPHAIAIALQLGLKYLRLPDVEGLRVTQPVTIDSLVILPTSGCLPQGGCFLQGPFDNFAHFPMQRQPDHRQSYGYIQTFIRPLLKLPRRPPSSELVIHIRSGDIFSTYVHRHYVQPPLSFYKAVVCNLQERALIDRVRVVFEDRLNPCIDALEAWLNSTATPVEMQSQDFYQDLVSMIDCSHFCFGLGSLGPAVCCLSEHIESVHHFQSRHEKTGVTFESVNEINEYLLTQKYITLGTWNNTDEQRRLMLDFPAAFENHRVVLAQTAA